MGVMVHLRSTVPGASQIAIGLALLGVIALVVDYTRMLLLRQKMVRLSSPARLHDSLLLTVFCSLPDRYHGRS